MMESQSHFDLHFPDGIGHVFNFFLDIKDFSFGISLFSSVPHFSIGLFHFLVSNFLSSLYILDISLLSCVGLEKIFSHPVVCHFVLLTVSLALQKFSSVS